MSPLDGHVSPLRLLRALVQAFEDLGGGFGPARASRRSSTAAGNSRFAPAARHAPPARSCWPPGWATGRSPRGWACEPRCSPIAARSWSPSGAAVPAHPTLYVRQTGEGVVQIGDSKEDVGLDDGTTLAQLSRIAARAARCFPLLEGVNVVRTWGALRVMSPDGFPIYQASQRVPRRLRRHLPQRHHAGAAARGAACRLDPRRPEPDADRNFKAERFDVQTH
jgi:glycine/D-amino acid oxidase-like deaminating enzyme